MGGAAKLHYEKPLDSLILAFEQYRLCFQGASSALSLVKELVTVVRLASGDLPGSGDLKPLRRRLVRSNFWHLSFLLPVSDSES